MNRVTVYALFKIKNEHSALLLLFFDVTEAAKKAVQFKLSETDPSVNYEIEDIFVN